MKPLTPPECDLQDFPFMPLHVARLRDSDLASEAHPEACWYAVLLWAASWHQLPAGSLPDNDVVLTKLCGLGRDMRTFRKHKDEAMRGFVLCDDGRLYHPVVAEQAVAAWDSKLQQRWRTECARIKKANQRTGADLAAPTFEQFMAPDYVSPQPQAAPSPPLVPEDTAQCPPGQGLQETQTGTGISKKEAIASPVGSAEPMPTPDPWSKDIDFAKAWDACTEAGRKRSSRKKAWPEWRAALKRETGPVLAAAMARYVASDEDAKRTGGPGFHSWLKDGRYEHWTAPTPAGASTTATFDGPPDLRAAVVRERDEDFARRWLDHYCRWRPGDRTLLAANETVAAALKRDLAGWLNKAQVRVEVAAANTNAPLLDLGAAA